jgi:hypothetical protein
MHLEKYPISGHMECFRHKLIVQSKSQGIFSVSYCEENEFEV